MKFLIIDEANYFTNLAEQIKRAVLESTLISVKETTNDCRNTAIDYRRPITARILRRIQIKGSR